MEIDGAPESIMSYIAEVHKIKVSTVDFCDKDILIKFLKSANVFDYHVYNEGVVSIDISQI